MPSAAPPRSALPSGATFALLMLVAMPRGTLLSGVALVLPALPMAMLWAMLPIALPAGTSLAPTLRGPAMP